MELVESEQSEHSEDTFVEDVSTVFKQIQQDNSSIENVLYAFRDQIDVTEQMAKAHKMIIEQTLDLTEIHPLQIPIKAIIMPNFSALPDNDPINLIVYSINIAGESHPILMCFVDTQARHTLQNPLFWATIAYNLNLFIQNNLDSYKIGYLVLNGRLDRSFLKYISGEYSSREYPITPVPYISVVYEAPVRHPELGELCLSIPLKSSEKTENSMIWLNNKLLNEYYLKIQEIMQYFRIDDCIFKWLESGKTDFFDHLMGFSVPTVVNIPARKDCNAHKIGDAIEIYVDYLFKNKSKGKILGKIKKIIKKYKISAGIDDEKIIELIKDELKKHWETVSNRVDNIFSEEELDPHKFFPLSWIHIIDDILVKDIRYSSMPDFVVNLQNITEEYLNDKTEVVFAKSLNRTIIYIDGDKIHYRQFTDDIGLTNVEESSQHRIIDILNCLVIFLMRINIEKEKLLQISNDISEVFLQYETNFLRKFSELFKAQFLVDFESDKNLEILFSQGNGTYFLDHLVSNYDNKIRSRRKSTSSNDEPPVEDIFSDSYQEVLDQLTTVTGIALFKPEDIIQTLLNIKIIDDLSILCLINVQGVHKSFSIDANRDKEFVEIIDSNNICDHANYLSLLNLVSNLTYHKKPKAETPNELKLQKNHLYFQNTVQEKLKIIKLIYVVTSNDDVLVSAEGYFRKEGEKFASGEIYHRPTHSQLSQGRSVKAAGEIFLYFYDNCWNISEINNGSGHFHPPALLSLPRAKEIILSKLPNFIKKTNVKISNSLHPGVTLLNDSQNSMKSAVNTIFELVKKDHVSDDQNYDEITEDFHSTAINLQENEVASNCCYSSSCCNPQ